MTGSAGDSNGCYALPTVLLSHAMPNFALLSLIRPNSNCLASKKASHSAAEPLRLSRHDSESDSDEEERVEALELSLCDIVSGQFLGFSAVFAVSLLAGLLGIVRQPVLPAWDLAFKLSSGFRFCRVGSSLS